MHKVAIVDDTFIVTEEFEEDTKSADEFKERILNTNLIINRSSFSSNHSQRPDQASILKFNPSAKVSGADSNEAYMANSDDEDETEMIKLPSGTKRLDSVSSSDSFSPKHAQQT